MGKAWFPLITLLLISAACIAIFRRQRSVGRNRGIAALRACWGMPGTESPDAACRAIAEAWHAAACAHDDDPAAGETDIDDATWNDLELDLFYAALVPLSGAGRSVLYHMLRRPCADVQAIMRRDALICAVGALPTLDGLSLLLAGLGHEVNLRTGLLFEGGTPLPGWVPVLQRCLNLLLPVALLAALLGPPVCWLLPVGIVAGSFALRWRVNRWMDIERSLPTLLYLMRMLRTADSLCAQLPGEAFAGVRAELERLGAKLRGIRRNPLLALFLQGDMLTLYVKTLFGSDILSYHRMLRDLSRRRDEVAALYALIGELDALRAIASFRAGSSCWCAPCFEVPSDVRPGVWMDAKKLQHPMLPQGVPNDVVLSKPLLLTGANASGKSTCLRSVGLAAIMAQSLATCCARTYRAQILVVKSSMALTDSVVRGESYFMAELRSLLRILHHTGSIPCLALIDEVLRGTNTQERIAAAYADRKSVV